MSHRVFILTSVLLVSSLILAPGCITIVMPPDKGGIKDASALLESRGSYKFGELQTVDLKPDGSASKYVYKLPTEEVAKDLFLDRSIAYDKTNKGYMGTLTLQFKNTGQSATTYSHVERIPKSFAASVNDLTFSIPPTQIINSDPELRWDTKLIKDAVTSIEIKAKKAVTSAVGKSGAAEEAATAAVAESFEQIGKALSGEDYDFNKALEAGKKAGIEKGTGPVVEAIIGVMLENFDDFALIAAINKCASLKNQQRTICILQMVERFPDRFNRDICSDITREITDSEEARVSLAICNALVTNDISECQDLNEPLSDLCKGYIIETICDDIKDLAERDACYYDNANICDCIMACLKINEQDRQNHCLARATGDNKHCEKIKDPAWRNQLPCSEEKPVLDMAKYKTCNIHFSFRRADAGGEQGTDFTTKGAFSGSRFTGRGDYRTTGVLFQECRRTGTMTVDVAASSNEVRNSKVANFTAKWTEKYPYEPPHTYEYTLTVRDIPYYNTLSHAVTYLLEKGDPRLETSLANLTIKRSFLHGTSTESNYILTRCSIIFATR
ncbi:MAG: hypothetical protein FJ008_02195 [Chloroflexi bacterium]|nr:hypothetical protein [Chloroflexota bacterium]MBM3154126.1 hypothetical protein [Chloroflexota bacterium]MBM3173599.1 hypothetical protein [Chloroflexota bacterium]MBM3175291.1 hypothetical protein [Chloroflexota bacterium]MBM4450855.1 hypothetical protein [Chloroflexota bacterium]